MKMIRIIANIYWVPIWSWHYARHSTFYLILIPSLWNDYYSQHFVGEGTEVYRAYPKSHNNLQRWALSPDFSDCTSPVFLPHFHNSVES